VDADPAADAFELAAFLELVDERDRVDGLALGVQAKGGAVDLRVALAVEVGSVERLADRPDCPRGEHHRAEDGLLGIEILRRDRGGLRGLRCLGDLGDLSHSGGVKPGRVQNGRPVHNRLVPTRQVVPTCRHYRTYVRRSAGQICG